MLNIKIVRLSQWVMKIGKCQNCPYKKIKFFYYYFSYLLSPYCSAWFLYRFKFLAQKSVKNLIRLSDIFAVISCLSRKLLPRYRHLRTFLFALVVTSLLRCLELQYALGLGAKMTTQIVSLATWPRPCVLVAGITAVQCCITTEDWCRGVTSELGRQFGNGLWLNFLWLSFMIPDKNFIC